MIQVTKGRIHSPSQEVLATLPADGGPTYNRLIFESSPYLLQHATNPVAWWPWGEEAFERARQEQKPIFLSIGYATCHWCHVMEHESFENPKAADLLNSTFICIKVDKEERPDIDTIYMQAVIATTGHGGWPMTVLLTHDAQPFFAGTYLPLLSRGGRMGLVELTQRVDELWKTKRGQLESEALDITQHLQRAMQPEPGAELSEATLTMAYQQLERRYDPKQGGFGKAPKFPTPHHFMFLLRYGLRFPESKAWEMVTHSLRKMRQGGVYDQVGYGFHRYATDKHWLLPHFEKMLYDQALLAMAYTEAYAATAEEDLARVAREIFTYVLRDMLDEAGGFYSAEDADSEGVEGKFYVWSLDELSEVLGPEDAKLYAQIYQIQADGNFREEATGHKTGDNIPYMTQTLEQIAQQTGKEPGEVRSKLAQMRHILFSLRESRIHPLKDDKILTDWNGLMIAALAKAARVLDEPPYAQAAARAAKFLLTTLRDEQGRLLKRYRNGVAGLPAHLDDYAFLIWGLIELHQFDFNLDWLCQARELTDYVLKHFHDPQSDAFFFTANNGEPLIVRSQESYDGAIPSGNSVMVNNLLRLNKLVGDFRYAEAGSALLAAFSSKLADSPANSTMMVCGLDLLLGPTSELVIVGDPESRETRAMVQAVASKLLPNLVVHLKSSLSDDSELTALAPYTEAMTTLEGRPTAYLCRNQACANPTTEMGALLQLLAGIA